MCHSVTLVKTRWFEPCYILFIWVYKEIEDGLKKCFSKGVNFTNIFARTGWEVFFVAQIWWMANSVWRISAHKFAYILLVKLDGRFFFVLHYLPVIFRLAHKVWWNRPQTCQQNFGLFILIGLHIVDLITFSDWRKVKLQLLQLSPFLECWRQSYKINPIMKNLLLNFCIQIIAIQRQ